MSRPGRRSRAPAGQADKPGKAIRLNVTMDEGLVAAIDRVAKNRSGFLTETARAALDTKRELPST